MQFLKKWIPFIVFCLLIAFIILIVPERIYFSKTTNRVETDTLILVLIFIMPLVFVPFIFPKKFIRFYVGFVVFGFAGYVSTNFYRKEKTRKELLSNSISIVGIVNGKRYFNASRNNGHWEFFCEFKVNSNIYKTFYQKDMKNKIENGDTLQVLFLKRNPEISEVILLSDY